MVKQPPPDLVDVPKSMSNHRPAVAQKSASHRDCEFPNRSSHRRREPDVRVYDVRLYREFGLENCNETAYGMDDNVEEASTKYMFCRRLYNPAADIYRFGDMDGSEDKVTSIEAETADRQSQVLTCMCL